MQFKVGDTVRISNDLVTSKLAADGTRLASPVVKPPTKGVIIEVIEGNGYKLVFPQLDGITALADENELVAIYA